MKKEVSWTEYYFLIENLAKKIQPHINEYDQLLCLARGGVFLGDAFSRYFTLPLAIMFTSSYKLNQQRGELYIDNQIAKQTNTLGKNILLLDDMVDSGITMEKVVNQLKNEFSLSKIHTGVLWKKPHSVFNPTYFVETIPNDTWLEQPFETVKPF